MYRAEPVSREIRTAQAVREDAGRYLRAHRILTELKMEYRRRKITFQQYSTMRGQALAGDVDGAVKGLAKVLRDREMEGTGL